MGNSQPFLVVAYDLIGKLQAGPAIRTLALATELAKICPVDVLFEGDTPENHGYLNFIKRDSIRPDSDFFAKYRAALAPPLVAMTFPELLDSDIPITIDLFDPVIWENLDLYKNMPISDRHFQHERHLASLMAGLVRGDFFLVAGDRQRDLFMGMLTMLNRVNPSTWSDGFTIDNFIGLVPFGLPETPPPSTDQLPVPEIFRAGGKLVVWGGGMWDWLSPETVVNAWPEVLKKFPDVCLAFPGTKHPNPHVPEMDSVGRIKKIAVDLGITNTIIFSDWLSRDEYLGLLARADVGVSAHKPGLEARYAVRTRFMDAIYVGLPMVVSGGDEYSHYMEKYSIGKSVSPSDSSSEVEFSKSIIEVLENRKDFYTDGFKKARADLAWPKMAAPLIEWVKDPKTTHGPGSEFFEDAVGQASPRHRPKDFGSLMHRVMSKLKK
jgi:glycosyltransferase involved in cell wall biosynthesis